MRKFTYVCGVLFAIGCAIAVLGNGDHNKKGTDYVVRVVKFAEMPKKEADQAADKILEAHGKITNDLISQLHLKPPAEAKLYLIYVLGEMREESAVSILVDNIDFKAPYLDEATRFARWGEYPATGALVNIGASSAREIASRLPKEQAEFRRKCMVGVVRGVYGEKPGKVFLEGLLDSQKTDDAKTNVKKSIEFYDDFGKKK